MALSLQSLRILANDKRENRISQEFLPQANTLLVKPNPTNIHSA